MIRSTRPDVRNTLHTARTGFTRNGEEVHINTTWKVEGGYEGYVLNGEEIAVLVFIPAEE